MKNQESMGSRKHKITQSRIKSQESTVTNKGPIIKQSHNQANKSSNQESRIKQARNNQESVIKSHESGKQAITQARIKNQESRSKKQDSRGKKQESSIKHQAIKQSRITNQDSRIKNLDFVYACVVVLFLATSTPPAEALLWKCKNRGPLSHFLPSVFNVTE